MKRQRNAKPILAILLGCVIILAALGGYVWRSNAQTASVKKVPGSNCQSQLRDNVVIFYYKPDTSPARQQEIIASVGGTVERTYDSLHGYSIKVTSSQDEAMNKLKGYPEVTTVSAEHTSCML